MNKLEKFYGYHPVRTALQLQPEKLKEIYMQKTREDERFNKIEQLAEEHNIPIKRLSRQALSELIGHSHHQGIAALSSVSLSYHEAMLPDLLASIDESCCLLILDGVQDPHNLGACLRSANAMGVHAVIAPKNRAVGLTPTVRKIACGAAESTPFIQVTNLARTLRFLKQQNIWIIGATVEGDTLLSDVDLVGQVALVLGSEGKGLRALTRKHCDFEVRIPMHGIIESLNVSVAAGICLYETVRQRIQLEE